MFLLSVFCWFLVFVSLRSNCYDKTETRVFARQSLKIFKFLFVLCLVALFFTRPKDLYDDHVVFLPLWPHLGLVPMFYLPIIHNEWFIKKFFYLFRFLPYLFGSLIFFHFFFWWRQQLSFFWINSLISTFLGWILKCILLWKFCVVLQ